MVTILILSNEGHRYSFNNVFFSSAIEAQNWYAEQKHGTLASITEEELLMEPYRWESSMINVYPPCSTENIGCSKYIAFKAYCEGTMTVHEVAKVTINENTIEAPFADSLYIMDTAKLALWLMDVVREKIVAGETITTLLVNGVEPPHFSLAGIFNNYKDDNDSLLPFELAVKYAFNPSARLKGKKKHCEAVQTALHVAALEVVESHYQALVKLSDAINSIRK